MTRPEIVINVYGGVVQEVFCSDEGADVRIVDWDVAGIVPCRDDQIEVKLAGSVMNAIVVRPVVQPLHMLAGTDVEAAIETAEAISEMANESTEGVYA
ncbi:MAG: hypothetical protein AB7I37_12145 [Pirellulales bacterium]